jgi:hypothetical protein
MVSRILSVALTGVRLLVVPIFLIAGALSDSGDARAGSLSLLEIPGLAALGEALESALQLYNVTSRESDRAKRLNQFNKHTSELLEKQQKVLEELSRLNVIVREVLRRRFQENEVGRFEALAENYNRHAALNDLSGDWLVPTKREIDRVSYRIGNYDVAVFPTFSAALTLELALHNLSDSSPLNLVELLRQRKEPLARWLDAAEPASIVTLVANAEAELRPFSEALKLQGNDLPVAEYIVVSGTNAQPSYVSTRFLARFAGINPDRSPDIQITTDAPPTLDKNASPRRSGVKRRYDYSWNGQYYYYRMGEVADSGCVPGYVDIDSTYEVPDRATVERFAAGKAECLRQFFDRAIRKYDVLSERLAKLSELKAAVVSMSARIDATVQQLQDLVDRGAGAARLDVCRLALGVTPSVLPACTAGPTQQQP